MSERAPHLCLTSLALFEASLLSPNLFAPGFLLDTVEICDLFDQDSAHSRSPNFGSFFLSLLPTLGQAKEGVILALTGPGLPSY